MFHNIIRLRLSVLSFVHYFQAKTGEGMEMVMVPWDVGRQRGCCGGWLGEGKGETRKDFSAACAGWGLR